MIVSVILYFLFESKRFSQMKQLHRQLIAGLVFGVLAICGTQFGVPFNGAIINARDASVLCGALIFGGPAGVIAGLIGGLHRWFSTAGEYTRLACSISTALAGFLGSFIRMHLLDDDIPDFSQAFITGVIVETLHMTMIFLTNINDIRRAFTYVEACTLPMISVNALSVAVAVFMIGALSNKEKVKRGYSVPGISSQVQKWLLLMMLTGFAITLSFNILLHNSVSDEDIRTMLTINIDDAVNDLKLETERYIVVNLRSIRNEITGHEDYDLKKIMKSHSVSEINIVSENGIITDSTDPDYIGFDMKENAYTREFLRLLQGTAYHVQALRTNVLDINENKKYAGIRYDDGFIEIAYDVNEYHELMESSLSELAFNRHIGETGKLAVIDEHGWIVSETDGYYGIATAYGIPASSSEDHHEHIVYRGHFNGEDVYFMYTTTEGYAILGIYPVDEADFSKRISLYLSVFMETIVFGLLYAAIYEIIKTGVVKNIVGVNRSLEEITGGNLDTVVNVRSNREFVSLSDGINATVDKLKSLIKEASERIDSELQYARAIQSSALPSVFPPYPERNEFDIYALMDPAREVGGDFYDFYLINDDTLVFLVADVSGKGIPASLFMMRAKTTIKSMAENGVSVNDIFTNANYHLCEGNKAGMFVTAWIGFLDLKTGELKFANAGHNKPLLKRKKGTFEFLDAPAGFILGGMEGINYKQQDIRLKPGDELFLYTDGVVEATNRNKELYGNERLQDCLNAHAGEDVKALCESVRKDVDEFYDGAEQFDDITELSLKFLKYTKKPAE